MSAEAQQTRITFAESERDLLRCFDVMSQLRPDLKKSQFVATIRRMGRLGYRLVYLEDEGDVKAVAGFRILEMLSRGRFLYVDDLVTHEEVRSRGYGDQLFEWLLAYAAKNECQQLDLDSGVHRHQAHRFYFRKRMKVTSYHFEVPTKNNL